jgi:hypothetical protein
MQAEVDDKGRYYTKSWIAAEREATEAYKRGGLKRFKSVQEMADYIESGIEADHIYLRNIGGHEILP